MFGSQSLASNGDEDIFIAKVSGATGQVIWTKTAGGPHTDIGFGIALDATGNACVVGTFIRKATIANSMLTTSGDNGDVFVWKTPSNAHSPWRAGSWR